MPRILKDLTITEVSSVDRGAGRGVKVLLMKRDDGAKPGDSEMTEAEIAALVAKSVTEAVTKAVSEVTAKGADEMAVAKREIAILKMKPAHKSFFDGLKDEDAKKAFADMSDEDKDKECAKVAKAADVVTNGDMVKRDEALSAVLQKNEDLQKRLDAADLREAQADFKKRAAGIGLTAEGDGELMRKAFTGDAEAQKAFEKRQAEVVSALSKQVEAGALFDTFGTNKGLAGDAMQALNAKRDELLKTEAGKGLSPQQAFAKVYEDPANAELVRQNKIEENRRSIQVVA